MPLWAPGPLWDGPLWAGPLWAGPLWAPLGPYGPGPYGPGPHGPGPYGPGPYGPGHYGLPAPAYRGARVSLDVFFLQFYANQNAHGTGIFAAPKPLITSKGPNISRLKYTRQRYPRIQDTHGNSHGYPRIPTDTHGNVHGDKKYPRRYPRHKLHTDAHGYTRKT